MQQCLHIGNVPLPEFIVSLNRPLRFMPRCQKLWRGKDEVREGFLPQFRGDYGDIQFHTEDQFIDEVAQEALVRWLCTFEWKGTRRAWRGLDILRFRDGLIVEKLTYAKTERPLTKVEPM